MLPQWWTAIYDCIFQPLPMISLPEIYLLDNDDNDDDNDKPYLVFVKGTKSGARVIISYQNVHFSMTPNF